MGSPCRGRVLPLLTKQKQYRIGKNSRVITKENQNDLELKWVPRLGLTVFDLNRRVSSNDPRATFSRSGQRVLQSPKSGR